MTKTEICVSETNETNAVYRKPIQLATYALFKRWFNMSVYQRGLPMRFSYIIKKVVSTATK